MVYSEMDLTNLAVYLTDENRTLEQSRIYYNDADRWASENCSSYVGYDVQDVSDVSYYYDTVACYVFDDEQDVVMFTLKWK
jgi:hypothetical protein